MNFSPEDYITLIERVNTLTTQNLYYQRSNFALEKALKHCRSSFPSKDENCQHAHFEDKIEKKSCQLSSLTPQNTTFLLQNKSQPTKQVRMSRDEQSQFLKKTIQKIKKFSHPKKPECIQTLNSVQNEKIQGKIEEQIRIIYKDSNKTCHQPSESQIRSWIKTKEIQKQLKETIKNRIYGTKIISQEFIPHSKNSQIIQVENQYKSPSAEKKQQKIVKQSSFHSIRVNQETQQEKQTPQNFQSLIYFVDHDNYSKIVTQKSIGKKVKTKTRAKRQNVSRTKNKQKYSSLISSCQIKKKQSMHEDNNKKQISAKKTKNKVGNTVGEVRKATSRKNTHFISFQNQQNFNDNNSSKNYKTEEQKRGQIPSNLRRSINFSRQNLTLIQTPSVYPKINQGKQSKAEKNIKK